MATRNRTLLFRKYRNSRRSVRAPMTEAKPGVGPVIEMAGASLLHPKRSYAPVSTEDPGSSRYKTSLHLSICAIELLELLWIA